MNEKGDAAHEIPAVHPRATAETSSTHAKARAPRRGAAAVGPATHDAGEGEWRVKGLPQQVPVRDRGDLAPAGRGARRGEGSRVARRPADLVPAGSRGRRRRRRPSCRSSRRAPRSPRSARGSRAACSSWGRASPRPTPPSSPTASGSNSPRYTSARAAVGVQDEDGMLNSDRAGARRHPRATTAKLLDALSRRQAVRMLVTGDTHALLGGTLDLSAQPFVATLGATADDRPRRGPRSPSRLRVTPVVPPEVWQKPEPACPLLPSGAEEDRRGCSGNPRVGEHAHRPRDGVVPLRSSRDPHGRRARACVHQSRPAGVPSPAPSPSAPSGRSPRPCTRPAACSSPRFAQAPPAPQSAPPAAPHAPPATPH